MRSLANLGRRFFLIFQLVCTTLHPNFWESDYVCNGIPKKFFLVAVSCNGQDPDPPHSCYFCRSDKNIDCLNKPANTPTFECNNNTLTAFQDDLDRHPPQKPFPPYTRALGTITRWGCYFMLSSDQTFAMRSCIVITEYQGDSCNHCRFGGHWATCCICKTNDCNVQLSQGSRLFAFGLGDDERNAHIINQVTVGLFTLVLNLLIRNGYEL